MRPGRNNYLSFQYIENRLYRAGLSKAIDLQMHFIDVCGTRKGVRELGKYEYHSVGNHKLELTFSLLHRGEVYVVTQIVTTEMILDNDDDSNFNYFEHIVHNVASCMGIQLFTGKNKNE